MGEVVKALYGTSSHLLASVVDKEEKRCILAWWVLIALTCGQRDIGILLEEADLSFWRTMMVYTCTLWEAMLATGMPHGFRSVAHALCVIGESVLRRQFEIQRPKMKGTS